MYKDQFSWAATSGAAYAQKGAPPWKLGKVVAFDTEGTGLDVPHIDSPFAFSFCNEKLNTVYFEFDVDPFTRKPIPVKREVAWMRKILESKKIEKCAHNAPYDIRAMEACGIDVAEPYHDTLIEVKRAKTDLFQYGLKPLAKAYLQMDDTDEKELKDVIKRCRVIARKLGWNVGEKVAQDYWLPRAIHKHHIRYYESGHLNWGDRFLCEEYCRKDAQRCMLLHQLMGEVMGEVERAGYEREMALMPIVIEMMRVGWRVHPDKIEETRNILLGDIAQLKKSINLWADVPLEKFTNTTLANLVYDDLGLDSGDNTRSVDQPHLENLDHDVAGMILDLRTAEGCISKFLNPFEKFSVREGKQLIMYPMFNQAGAKTFRFSAKRPPIQTIPDAGKSKSNMSARQCIGPRDGEVWYLIDYSGLQVRIFADMARDETMLDALANGIKPHAAAARMAWNGSGNKPGLRIMKAAVELSGNRDAVQKWCDSNSVLRLFEDEQWADISEALLEENEFDIIDAEKCIGSKSAYAKAKTMFFLKLFGGGAGKAAKGLRCTVKEAKQILREYAKAMPRIAAWSREVIQFAVRNGYILTPYGDKIHTTPGFEYQAVAHKVQATEAALVKDRMRELDNSVLPNTPFRLLGTIHDELGFTAPKKNMRSHKPILRRIKSCMEDHTGHLTIDVPCEVDLVRTHWNDREEVKL